MKTLIERAFDFARSGEVRSVAEIERRLGREGFRFSDIQGQIGAPLVRRQLSELARQSARHAMAAARSG